MLRVFRARREPLDFAQIVGSCTDDGRKAGASWDNVNLADGSNERAQELASYFVDFHKRLLGVPTMEGLLELSASLANYRALELARDTTRKNKVLCSNLSHVSIVRAADSLRLETIVLDVDPTNYQVRDEEIARAISHDGKHIAAIVSTYGTTQLGHVERLAESELVKQLRSEGAWLHVDAAYGGYVGTLSSHIKAKVPDADSITIDPYKFVGKPGVALLLVYKNKAPKTNVEYYVHSPFTVHTTLSAGPVAAWGQTVRDCGDVYGLREIADQCVEIVRRTGAELRRQGISLVHFPEMSIVPVTLDSPEEVDYVHGKLLNEGFSVGKIRIAGRDYEMNGIRMVVTPKVNPDLMYGTASKLVDKIVEAIKTPSP
ncbi:DegT/DnrJ/EryC1/StrS family aminotransferase [Candidatus Woesearchaeota archaeon]|nr:DegT/DnrJ/EryC1/StrS family aminotransferase [Candidatus Woesearchaeota archaeon]